MFKNFHAIIFRVKIFSYASRPYENILTTKIFLQREFRVQRYTYVVVSQATPFSAYFRFAEKGVACETTYVETHGRAA